MGGTAAVADRGQPPPAVAAAHDDLGHDEGGPRRGARGIRHRSEGDRAGARARPPRRAPPRSPTTPRHHASASREPVGTVRGELDARGPSRPGPRRGAPSSRPVAARGPAAATGGRREHGRPEPFEGHGAGDQRPCRGAGRRAGTCWVVMSRASLRRRPASCRRQARAIGEDGAHDPRQPRQGPPRRRRDVRRRRRQVRPHQRRPLPRAGPAVAQGRGQGRGGRAGRAVLDIAAGTGTCSEPFADAGVDVVPADFSLGMLRVGNRRRPDLGFTAADAMRLPFADESASTPSRCRSGCATSPTPVPRCASSSGSPGRAAGWWSASSASPVNAAFRKVYTEYLMRSLPPIARQVSCNPESYVYLAESIQAWPAQRELAARPPRRGLVRGRLAQPHRRHRGPAPGRQARWAGARGRCRRG